MPVLGVLLAAFVGGIAVRALHVPGGLALGAMVGATIYSLAQGADGVPVPSWLQDGALIVIGAVIGAGISRGMLVELRSLLVPAVVAGGLVIVAGVGIALLLRWRGVAPPEDLLATSPGALSAVLGIALDRGVAPAQVALFHVVRLLMVIASLPLLVLALPRGRG